MWAHVIDWSVRNKFFVLLATGFLCLWGIWSMRTMPLDAIPDLSDVQVIVFTEYSGQGPQVVEDQVTYPITTRMLAVPFAKVVRGYSFFGFSFVYVIFEDGTDLYWARSRVLEYLNYVQGQLPKGVTPTLGPDATGVGWGFMYALTSTKRSLADLRSLQDWYLKYQLETVEGVSEVASIGGFVRQYQIVLDPNKLRAYNIPISKVRRAVQRSNQDVGGRLIEFAEQEFIVRGLGYIKKVSDVEKIVVAASAVGTPVLLRDLGRVVLGPDIRRGLAELNGDGEVVGGIVVMRWGSNARDVINKVKTKLAEIQTGLPKDVEITITYDRTGLIERSIDTLSVKLIEECLVVALVCLFFLFHMSSALVAIVTLPAAILISFIVMKNQGLNANIMSLGGIAIAIGAMVDAAIIMIENVHKHMERDHGKKPSWQIVLDASKEVGPTLFYSLLVITISFIPVFTLEQQEGRLFKPLAFTKTYSMAAAAFLSITLVPILMGFFIRGRFARIEEAPARGSARWKWYGRQFFLRGAIFREEDNPINRWLIKTYQPVLYWSLRHKWKVIAGTLAILVCTLWPYSRLGSEFMPPLYEGDLLYMPTTLPGISVTKAREILQKTDQIIKQFPEVHHVFGKIGRAETATDPAPLTMIETTVMLHPEDHWPKVIHNDRWYDFLPGALQTPFTWVWPKTQRRTIEELITALNDAVQFPGLTNAWTMPIKTRIDMLSTGIKTPIGIKIGGPDLEVLQDLGEKVEAAIQKVPGTLSAYAERTVGGNYLDWVIDRDAIARYGLTIGDVQDVIQSAIGGMNVTQTVEGLERYPVNIRYERALRSSLADLRQVLVPSPLGQHVPLGHLAEIKLHKGPAVIKSEGGRPNTWVYVDIIGIDIGTYVGKAKEVVQANVKLPPGYTLIWSGQYEYMERAKKRLLLVIPLTIFIIFIIIFLNTQSLVKTAIVFAAVPFSLVGAIWLLYLLDYNLSIAVWVGIIALAGLDAETGVVMLLYLDVAYDGMKKKGQMTTQKHLVEAIEHGAVQRIRPKIMTASVILAGLMPIMWSHGAGADVMKRIATPMVGGVVTSVVLELLVYPAIYFIWRNRSLPTTTQKGSTV